MANNFLDMFLAAKQMGQHREDLATQLAEAAKDREMRQAQFDASMGLDRERLALMRSEEARRAQENERAHKLAVAQLFGSGVVRSPNKWDARTVDPFPASAIENGTGPNGLPSIVFQSTIPAVNETGDADLGGGVFTTPEERNASAVRQQLTLNEALSEQEQRTLNAKARTMFPNDPVRQDIFRMYRGDLSKLDDNNMLAASMLATMPSHKWMPTILALQQMRYNNPYMMMQRQLNVQEDQQQAAARVAVGEAIRASASLPAEAQEANARTILSARIKDPAVLTYATGLMADEYRANRAGSMSPKDRALAPIWDKVGQALRGQTASPVSAPPAQPPTSAPPTVQPGQSPAHPAGGQTSVNPNRQQFNGFQQSNLLNNLVEQAKRKTEEQAAILRYRNQNRRQ